MIDTRSDVYGLGAVLYTLLTGRVPFDEGTVFKTILKVISDTPPEPLRNLRPDAPPQLEKICMRCLEKDPKNRYQTARALADDLKRFRDALSGKVSPASPRTSHPTVVLVSPGGKQVRLSKPATVIGRHQDCDLVVKGSEISKHHCRIVLALDEVVVEDLGSVNGTSVNGKQVERSRLKDGDELDVGGHVFQVVVSGNGRS